MIRIEFGGTVYYNYNKEPPPQHSIGNYLGPYVNLINPQNLFLCLFLNSIHESGSERPDLAALLELYGSTEGFCEFRFRFRM